MLATLASSMGVALENARLFGETKRLLTETDERAAELAIINSVQQGLAAQLDLQAMYDLVGDKIQETFDAQVVDIAIPEHGSDVVHFVYAIERGVRYPDDPTPSIDATRALIAERAPIVIDDIPAWEQDHGEMPVVQGEASKSLVRVPMIVGGDVRGTISLQNLDRTHAFSEADVRLLTTLAASLSVALENARLFGETRRHAAELAIINETQRALAAETTARRMYEILGEQVHDVFDAQVVDVAILDPAGQRLTFAYIVERGRASRSRRCPIGARKRVIETAEPLLVNDRVVERLAAMGQPAAIRASRRAPRSGRP